MHIVRAMRKYGDVRVANAMYNLGCCWMRNRPSRIDGMTRGMDRCDLLKVLNVLRERHPEVN